MAKREEYDKKYSRALNRLYTENADLKFLEPFYTYIRTRGIRNDSSATSYINIAVLFCRYCGKSEPKDFEPEDYEGFLLSYERKTPSYQVTIYAALRKLSQYLYERRRKWGCDEYYEDFMKSVKCPSVKGDRDRIEKKRAASYIEDKDLNAYIKMVESGTKYNTRAKSRQKNWKERDIALIMLMINTGLRGGAVRNLKTGDFNYEENTLEVVEKENKTRIIFLSDEMSDLLQEWIEKRDELMEGWERETDALFISNRRQPLSYDSIKDVVMKYGKGIKKITPHSLRRTCATNLYKDTQDLLAVKELLGHERTDTTVIYCQDKEERGVMAAVSNKNRYFKRKRKI